MHFYFFAFVPRVSSIRKRPISGFIGFSILELFLYQAFITTTCHYKLSFCCMDVNKQHEALARIAQRGTTLY